MKISPLADINVISQSGPTINANNDKIETAFDNTLSRDGSSPNQMNADIDMNSNDLLNVGLINTTSLTIQGQDVSALIAASVTAVNAAIAASASQSAAASSASAAAGSAAAVASQLANLPEWKGPWVTATAYELGDLVQESGNTYICVTAHTSGTFSTDLSAIKWQIFAAKGSAGAGTGDLLATNNLSELTNKATARSNLVVPSRDADTTISGNYTFVDNPTASIRFGTDQDVKVWWDNANTIFAFETLNTPTASLKFRFPLIEMMKVGGTETMAKFIADGAVELYYDNNKKFETLTGGAKVTGALQADTIAGSWISTNGEALAGTVNDKVMTALRVANAIDDRFSLSLGSSGYVSFKTTASGSRLYLQWGRYSCASPASSNQRVTFPITFPTAFLNGWVEVDNGAGQMLGLSLADRFGVTVQKGSGDVGVRNGFWFAMGY